MPPNLRVVSARERERVAGGGGCHRSSGLVVVVAIRWWWLGSEAAGNTSGARIELSHAEPTQIKTSIGSFCLESRLVFSIS